MKILISVILVSMSVLSFGDIMTTTTPVSNGGYSYTTSTGWENGRSVDIETSNYTTSNGTVYSDSTDMSGSEQLEQQEDF